MMVMDAFDWLQQWYREQCDGDWEHAYRVRISTLDNPGWSLDVNLAETDWDNLTLPIQSIRRSEDDWLDYWVKDQRFGGACGPVNLMELIEAFRRIVEGEQA